MAITSPVLKNGKPARERIGIYGPPGCGKTHQYFVIAKWHQDLGSDARFYAVSTDTSYEVLTMNEEFEELDNLEWTDVENFQEFLDAARRYKSMMRDQDWICSDLQSDAWAYVQDEYARVSTLEAGGQLEDMGDLWATAGSSEKYPIEGWEWGMPNARYRILANNILQRGKGHAMMIYGQKELMKDSGSGKTGETAETREMFGHIGLKPTGQKEDPFRYNTFIHLSSRGERQQAWSTAKERWGYREHVGKKMSNGGTKDEPFEDFFLDYLIKVAKWEM